MDTSFLRYALVISVFVDFSLGCGRVDDASEEIVFPDSLVFTFDNTLATSLFDDVPVVGLWDSESVEQQLASLESIEVSDRYTDSLLSETGFNHQQIASCNNKLYLCTEHIFGFIESGPYTSDTVSIVHAGTIEPDTSLRNSRIKITLDRLRVADYPGKGEHEVLFDFYAQNQIGGETEHVHFHQKYRVLEGSGAGVIGYPIFIGLNVGAEGVSFVGYTINVRNKGSSKFLRFLDSDESRSGLKFIDSLNPAIPTLSKLAIGITKMVANTRHNVPVQDFFLGLDYSDISTRARLAEGSYIVVQVPDKASINWNDWAYLRSRGILYSKKNATLDIPFNYVIISVTRYIESPNVG